MDVLESYIDYYTFSQWFMQSILYATVPRFTIKRLEATVKHETTKAPTDIPNNIKREFSASVVVINECRTHVIAPQNKSNVTVFYFHGGAYVMNFMNPFHFQFAASIIKATGSCTFILPEYPLVPYVSHEELFSIIESVYRQSVSERSSQKIVLMGDSAGGGIAFILIQRLVAAKKNGDDVRLPDSVILLSPWLDVSMSDPDCEKYTNVDAFLAVDGLKKAGDMLAGGPNPVSVTDPKVSPLFGSLESLPPVNIWTSTHDMLVVDSRRLLGRYKTENVPSRLRYFEKKGLLHCYFLFPGSGTPETIGEIATVIHEDCCLDIVKTSSS